MSRVLKYGGAWLMVSLAVASGCRDAAPKHSETGDTSPAKKVVFVSNREGARQSHIFVMNPDGSEVTKLSPAESLDFDPTWSPDAKRIAFVSVPKEKSRIADLFVMDADGSNRKQLTKNANTVAWSPCWFPDGKCIVFTQARDPSGRGPPEGDLYVINSDGTDLKKLGTGGLPASEGRVEGGGMMPSVSPNGTVVLFTALELSGEFEPRLFVMDADGKNPRQLIKNWAMNGKWSPEGKHIAFIGGPNRENTGLYVARADGSNPACLVKNTSRSQVGTMRWFADGTKVFFDRGFFGDNLLEVSSSIYVIDMDGTNEKQLTRRPGPRHISSLGPPGQAIDAAIRGIQ
jgi:Tol biopolymer transport system component